MKRTIYMILALLGLAVSSACSKDVQNAETLSLFTVSLSKSYSKIGTETMNSWQPSDQCAFFTSSGDGTMFTAPVLVSGSVSGDFRLNLPSDQASGMIALAYPVDGGFSFSDNSLNYNLDTVQEGVLENKMVGVAQAGQPSASRKVELKNGYCAIFLYAGKELGSIKSVEFKSKDGIGVSGDVSYNLSQRKYSASESSVKVEYPSALECTENTYIPLMVAPVTLSSGYEASVTTGSGEVVKFGSDQPLILTAGGKLLLTSSYSFAALIDIQTKELLWCTNRCPNAHSAVLLPNDRVAVATSSGDDDYHRKVLIYDLSRNHQEVYKTEVRSCHAVIWDEVNQMLHASGLHETDNSTGAVFSFKLKNWNTTSPSLELAGKGYTTAATKSLHDAVQVNDKTLMVGGNKAWFYSLTSGTYTMIPHFSRYTGIKSLNYNSATGECWYTASDNDVPVPDKESSTRILCYTNDINSTAIQKKIEIPQDIYKVRVINW